MAHIQWKDLYNTGNKKIDAQHKALLEVLNQLIDLVGERRDPDLVAGIFHRLCEYVLTHFATEERYMRAYGYPRLVEHEALHATFVQKLLALNGAYDPADPRLVDETLEFIKNWYLDHIIKSDLDYVPFLQRFQAEAPVKAILFDFGNVLCSFDNDQFLEGLSSLCGKPLEVLKTRIYLESTLPRDYEAGSIDSREFLKGVSRLCEQDLAQADFLRAYTGIFTPIEATFDLIRKLKPGYQLGLISNTSPWHFEQVIQKVEVFPLFDSVTLSFEVGASKPDPRLFDDALAKLDLMAEECIYIDDQRPYALAATEHHMRGLTYTTPVALMAQLRQLKVAF
jgi:HAD superfamily hydrolase (TIGR01509 family)